MGLVSDHAYSILDAQEVHIATKKGKKKERILKLSNPWGKYEWKGRWSDYSDVWSEELRQQLHFEKADDGIFWINIEDFVENFGQVCVCKYNKNYISTSLPLLFQKEKEKYICPKAASSRESTCAPPNAPRATSPSSRKTTASSARPTSTPSSDSSSSGSTRPPTPSPPTSTTSSTATGTAR
jgi:hypothetical protein